MLKLAHAANRRHPRSSESGRRPAVSAPLERDAPGPEISLRFITRDAEKLFNALAPDDQRRVARAIAQPPPRNRCELVTALAKERVFHFAVGESLRISFCQHPEGGNCIIHIGTHAEFDRFAKHYAGCNSTNVILLAESSIMAKTDTRPAAYGQQAVLEKIGEMFQLLGDGMREVIKETRDGLRSEIQSELLEPTRESLRKLERTVEDLTKKTSNEVAQIRGDSYKEVSQVAQRIDEAEKLCRDLASQTRNLQICLGQLEEGSKNALEKACNEIMDQMAHTAADLRGQMEAGLARLSDQHEAHRRKAEDQWQATSGRLEAAESRLHEAAQQSQQAECRLQAIESRLGAVDQHLAQVTVAAEAQRDALEKWQAHVTAQQAKLEDTLVSLVRQVSQVGESLAEARSRQAQSAADLAEQARLVAQLIAARNRSWGYRLRAWWDGIRRKVLGAWRGPAAQQSAPCSSNPKKP